MAPKAPDPPAAEEGGAEEEDPWAAQEWCCALVDALVLDTCAEIREKARTEAVVPYVVAGIAARMRGCVSGYFIDHDIGEPAIATASNWAAGAEPVPAPVDSWSRGAVPAKAKEVLQLYPEETPTEASSAVRRTSVPSSPRARTPNAPPGSGALTPGGKGDLFIAKPPPGAVDPKAGKKKVAPIVTASEKLKKRLDAEAREERERLERLQGELKGRHYTYDMRGNVIPMEEYSAERLPAFQQQPRLALGGAATRAAKGGRGGKGGAGGAGGAGGKKGGADGFGGGATFKQLDSLQPPLLESMAVQKGVLLTQNGATKGGDPREFEGDRITKEQFEEMANTVGGFASRRTPSAFDTTAANDAARGSANPLASAGGAPPSAPPPVDVSALSGNVPPAKLPAFMPSSPEPGEKQGKGNPSLRERGGMPNKDRLPPPAVGQTTGHGNPGPYPNSPDGLRQGSGVTTSKSSVRG